MIGAIRLVRRRLLTSIPVLLIVILFGFLLLEGSTGDAVDAYLGSIGGGDAGLRQALRASYGLDQSLFARLLLYLGSLARLDLGWSVAFNRPVADLIAERLPNTLLLMGSALCVSFGMGTILGILAGIKPDDLRGKVLAIGSLIIYAIPSFWLALVLSLIFAVRLRWFPISGIETIASGKTGFERAADVALHLVLPVATLSLIYMALFLRVMRSSMMDVAKLDFVVSARAKGLSRSRILFRYILRNSLLPVVTLFGLQAATMLGGSVVVESIFAIPGFGRLAQEAVNGRDSPLLVGIILTSAVVVIIVNLLVDLAYAVLDPRIRVTERRS
ncbi:ABC transporter permease [Oryzifoliimicrobium ureilyticus]|uniref:ABC transporter permease n=1 Tax=Oryzifoliimicrobium ureilyticus TaxID=3113724 RepID=UPI0030762EDE